MTITPQELDYQKWVAKALSQRMLMCLLGAVGCALAAAVVLWLTWWGIYWMLWFIVLSFSVPHSAIVIAAWVVFVLLFVAYGTANWKRLEKLEFESPAKMRVAEAAGILLDSPFLALTGPKNVSALVKITSVTVLVGPGIAATAWKLLQQALAGWRGSPEKVADLLKTLAAAGARVSLEELIGVDKTKSFVQTFAAVRLFDGVILRSSEPVGLVLTDELRNEILKRLPPQQLRSSVERPASRPSSSPPAPVKPPSPPPQSQPRKPPPSPPVSSPKPPPSVPPKKAPPPPPSPPKRRPPP